jgi:outer membrane protein TolC
LLSAGIDRGQLRSYARKKCSQYPWHDSASLDSGQSFNSSHQKQWVASFADPALSALVNAALNNNLDLKAAAARMDKAREQTIIAGAGRWLQLGFATCFPAGCGSGVRRLSGRSLVPGGAHGAKLF